MSRYFYSGRRLATKVSADNACSVFAGADVVLGEISEQTRWLLAVDRRNSIFKVQHSRSYSPYGFDQAASAESLLGYKGEHRDVTSGCDLLGNGVRAYSPVLMRFCSPDVISPFGVGGINAYVYCEGDPINYLDTDGRMKVSSPWAYEQPYGISQRSRAIQRVSQPSPPTAMQKMPVNDNRPLSSRVPPEGVSLQQLKPFDSSRQAVPKKFWANIKNTGTDPGAYANTLVNVARGNGVVNSSKFTDQLLISAIKHKIEIGSSSLKDWSERASLHLLGFSNFNSALVNLGIQINRVVRSNFPAMEASDSNASLASLLRWSENQTSSNSG
ncbi:RHS repeat-associated core domain-containing protein [Pseudomonas sp. NY11955]|uniref:RHS repeat-associated core domain-containing protein n=1 Tax=Pseudomonas sp. NY11955 TaxID=3400363 RepID=UPI003A8934D6